MSIIFITVGIWLPVSDICPECKDQYIGLSHDRHDPVMPALGIPLDLFDGILAGIDMAPGMGCEFPSLCLHGICHCGCLCHFFIEIKVRILIEEDSLKLCQAVFLPGLIYFIRPVTKHAFISGQCQDPFVSVVGEVRMLLDKGIDDRHDIVVPHRDRAIIFDICILDFAVIGNDQFLGKSVAVHIVIVAAVILAHHEWSLSGRKEDLLGLQTAVICHLHHVMQTHHHITAVIHLCQDRVELGHSRHDLIVAGFISITVKCLRIVPHQSVEKDMGNLVDRIRAASGLGCLIGRNQILEPVISVIPRL